MSLAKRLDMLARLRSYMLGNDPTWLAAKEKAFQHNGWFTPAFIDTAIQNIAGFLEPSQLRQWLGKYPVPAAQPSPKIIGLILSGNIPMAGIYDFICVYLSGHYQRIRLSPKDDVLTKHLVQKLLSWEPSLAGSLTVAEMLKGCHAFIVTGNNNPSFLHYLKNYPGLVHTSKPSAALLTGNEDRGELELLADDVFQYFGRGSLNIGKLYVPKGYDFIPLLKIFEKYGYLVDHNKYKNNYDYQLSLLILNKEFYMNNGSLLLTESKQPASPVARLHYEFYEDEPQFNTSERIVGRGYEPFGMARLSVMPDKTDGQDLLKFLLEL